ncbi:MAG: hypothetical protein KTR32_40135 [Granulosicoccus sp.]|nr:hypothetical protein [Granulosicoccus sp.]
MRNYLQLLGLSRDSDEQSIRAALAAVPAEERELEEDMRAVLMGGTERTHYERVHLQYQAMAAAADQLAGQTLVDTNQWSRRLVEFEVERDSLYDL